jgi:hypothetical protein
VDSRISYGSDQLADLCSLSHPATRASQARTLTQALVRHPSRALTLLALRRLPIVEPHLTEEEHDRWLEARWPAGGERLFGGHWAQAIIETSPGESEYLTGRHRQALRTNIRRAREQGMTAKRLDTYEEFARAAEHVYAGRKGGEAVLQSMRRPLPEERFAWYCASVAGSGTPVVIAAVAIFGDLGVLAVMVGDLRNPLAGHARYLLHNFVRSDLAAHDTRHLLVGSVLREPSGTRYFQRLLGYRICNLRPMLRASLGEPERDAGPAFRRLLMSGSPAGRAREHSRSSARQTMRPRPSEPVAASPPVEPIASAQPPERGPYVPAG